MNIFHAHYEFLKNEADLIVKRLLRGDQDVLIRFQQLRRFSETIDIPQLQRKHALTLLAVENGYASWSELKSALDEMATHSPLAEIGEQFYPKGLTTYWNIWFAKYAQASKVLQEGNGYLLPYKNQYFIVEEHFVDSIGLPHTMPEWRSIGRDWVHPRHVNDWLTLNRKYEKVIADRK